VGRVIAGAGAALLFFAAGLFWWQGRAASGPAPEAIIAQPPPPAIDALPEGDPAAVGKAPPSPGEATPQSREQKRFARYDRNRDGVITRVEMMGSRVKAFKTLDTDKDNLLSFEEWAVATSDRFGKADANADGKLTPAEFTSTAPKRTTKPQCKC
jgi:hypothetical protein